MTMKHRRLLLSLSFPIVALVALAGYKAYKVHSGTELTIPIAGYDPRDLLSGHYLTYRLDFDEEVCGSEHPNQDLLFLCVSQRGESISSRKVYSAKPEDRRGCTAVLQGLCKGGQFLAGVERYYIPEQHSRLLDRIVRGWGEDKGRARLVISVDYRGKAVVKELLIDGKPLRQFLADQVD